MTRAIPFDLINQALRADSPAVLHRWFPEGKVVGAEFKIGNIQGEPGNSLSFNWLRGFGQDFATGQRFGDYIDLYAARHGLEIADAARELMEQLHIRQDGITSINTAVEEPTEPAPVGPVPEYVTFTAHDGTFQGVAPSAIYRYTDAADRLLYVVCRYDADLEAGRTRKTFSPYTWSEEHGTWIRKAPAKPRPLYGLAKLAALSTKFTLIVEGEKAADAGNALFPDRPVLTWPGGAMAPLYADWSPVQGRTVIIWPDADQPGRKAAEALVPVLTGYGCTVSILDTAGLADGFDIADAVAAGWDRDRIRACIKDRAKPATAAAQPVILEDRAQLVQAVPEIPVRSELTASAVIAAGGRMTNVVPFPQVQKPKPVQEHAHAATWERLGLSRKSNGIPYVNLDNLCRILEDDPGMIGLHYDVFLNDVGMGEGRDRRKLTDTDALQYVVRIQRDYGIENVKTFLVEEAFALVARQRRRHCLQEWLSGLVWDGHARLTELMVTGFGAEDTAYHREVSRNFLISMVARGLKPGIQVDTLPILEGPQGVGKSQGLAALGGAWYVDTNANIGTREFAEIIRGKWLVEIAELASIRSVDIESIKAGITRTVDTYREPYSKLATDHPRACVFAGTTNAERYLQDSENRRFWPVRVGTVDLQWIRDNRDQLFAEAVIAFKGGAAWWKFEHGDPVREQFERLHVDDLQEHVDRYILEHINLPIIAADMIASWSVPITGSIPAFQRRVNRCLRYRGYKTVQKDRKVMWLPDDTPPVTSAPLYGNMPKQPPKKKPRKI